MICQRRCGSLRRRCARLGRGLASRADEIPRYDPSVCVIHSCRATQWHRGDIWDAPCWALLPPSTRRQKKGSSACHVHDCPLRVGLAFKRTSLKRQFKRKLRKCSHCCGLPRLLRRTFLMESTVHAPYGLNWSEAHCSIYIYVWILPEKKHAFINVLFVCLHLV